MKKHRRMDVLRIEVPGVLEKEIVISTRSEIRTASTEFVYFDKLPDGTWRMSYTHNERDAEE